jgi:WD40 repeat protein
MVIRVHTGTVYGASFDPSGRRILTAGDDGTVRLVPIDDEELRNEIRRSGNVRISEEDCRRFLRDASCPAVP